MKKIAKRLKEKKNYSAIVRRAIDHYFEYLGLNGAVKDFDSARLEKEYPKTNIRKILKNLEEKD